MSSVSVVIPTRGRPQLPRAVQSARRQDYGQPIEIVVVTAESRPLDAHLAEAVASMGARVLRVAPDAAAIATNPLLAIHPWARLAWLRNAGVTAASGELIAHLDDDNEFRPDHISSLVATLERAPRLSAAHSWRQLLYEDGAPYEANLYPWLKQPDLGCARYIFDELVHRGICRHDCSEMRDQYIAPGGEPMLTVDSSEWLIRRELQTQFPFPESPTFHEVSHGATDDYLFCKRLADAGVAVGCTERVTLWYYLGGQTTAWIQEMLRTRRA